jgi:hypothetical protein
MSTTPSAVGAASHYDMNWPTIDWGKAHRIVRRLQVRIGEHVSLFKVGVSRLSKSMSAGSWVRNQSIMSQKCIVIMDFRTILSRHRRR